MGNPLADMAIKVSPAMLKIGGTVAMMSGGVLTDSATKTMRQAQSLYDKRCAEALDRVRLVQQQINATNEYRQRQWDTTFKRLKSWFDANERKLKQINVVFDIEPIRISFEELPEVADSLSKRITVEGVKIVAAEGVRNALPKAVKKGIIKLGRAGTGMRIDKLHGIAQENASLANLGGGPIAKGGGGIEAGKKYLDKLGNGGSVATAGAISLVYGIYEQQKAKHYSLKANESIQQIENDLVALDAISSYCTELQTVCNELNKRALQTLVDLESLDFDPELHAEKFQIAMLNVTTLRQICNIPIIESGTFEVSQQLTNYFIHKKGAQNESK